MRKPHTKAYAIARTMLEDELSLDVAGRMPRVLHWFALRHILRERMKFGAFVLAAFIGSLVMRFYRRRIA